MGGKESGVPADRSWRSFAPHVKGGPNADQFAGLPSAVTTSATSFSGIVAIFRDTAANCSSSALEAGPCPAPAFACGLNVASRFIRAGVGRSSAVLPVRVFLTRTRTWSAAAQVSVRFPVVAQSPPASHPGSRLAAAWPSAPRTSLDVEVALRHYCTQADHSHPRPGKRCQGQVSVELSDLSHHSGSPGCRW